MSKRLSPNQIATFEMMQSRGARQHEIAAALNVSIDAIKGRLYRARHGWQKCEPEETHGFGWEDERVDLRRRVWERARQAAAEALRG